MIKNKFIKSLIPPFIFEILVNLKKKVNLVLGKKPHYSKEISFDIDMLKSTKENVWDSPNWINHVEKKLKSSYKDKTNIHQEALLETVKTIYYLTNKKIINVIDFGGGCGILIPHIRNLRNELKIKINSFIIDSETNINLGKKFLNTENINDVKFYNQTNFSLLDVLKNFKENDNNLVLNISSVIQYIHPYKKFLSNSLKDIKPLYVCITRFPKCENAREDAFCIQNISTPLGFCGSVIVNLFEKNSLIKEMKKLDYELLSEKYNNLGDIDYFTDCDDASYKKMTMTAYVFIKKTIH